MPSPHLNQACQSRLQEVLHLSGLQLGSKAFSPPQRQSLYLLGDAAVKLSTQPLSCGLLVKHITNHLPSSETIRKDSVWGVHTGQCAQQ